MRQYKNQDGNDKISEYLKSGRPFSYGRFGMGYETTIPFAIEHNQNYQSQLEKAHLHSGLYGGESDILFYYDKFIDSIKNRDIFLLWGGGMMEGYENYFMSKYPSDKSLYVNGGTNEPFRYKDPFSQHFEGKKVLVINNLIESIKAQWQRRSILFKDPKVLPDFELLTYKSVSSFLMNTPHSGWKESYEVMTGDISRIDFDIALVGCGSYGQPITDFIATELGKVAINTAGGTPLLFGVIGKRWQNDKGIQLAINKQNWIKPLKSETPQNGGMIEGGCYW